MASSACPEGPSMRRSGACRPFLRRCSGLRRGPKPQQMLPTISRRGDRPSEPPGGHWKRAVHLFSCSSAPRAIVCRARGSRAQICSLLDEETTGCGRRRQVRAAPLTPSEAPTTIPSTASRKRREVNRLLVAAPRVINTRWRLTTVYPASCGVVLDSRATHSAQKRAFGPIFRKTHQ